MKITTAKQLKASCDKGVHEYRIALKHSLISRKIIHAWGNTFYVENCIDGSKQRFNTRSLFDDSLTNIGKAMRMGAFLVDTR